jgi:hypothetical protein
LYTAIPSGTWAIGRRGRFLVASRSLWAAGAAELLVFGERGAETVIDRYFAFYRSDMLMVSPLVNVKCPWSVVNLLNRLPKDPNSSVFADGDMPESWCVDFVAAYCGLSKAGRDRDIGWRMSSRDCLVTSNPSCSRGWHHFRVVGTIGLD